MIATVSSAYATPTGSVTFKDGATTLGTKNRSSGVATVNVTTFSSGTHSITAVYAGTANFAAST
ncbi:MAG: Ig-like domain-containing protein [Thermoanaerobaculia bacterium]